MVAVNLKSLIGRLTETGRRQIEAAAGLTLSRSHYNVEIEHVLLKLIEAPGSDVAIILRKEGIDLGRVTAELNRSLDKLRTGNARAPSLSPDIVTWLREAWMIASLEGGQSTIRSGHMLAALLSDESLSRDARESCPSLAGISGENLRQNLLDLTAGSEENEQVAASSAPSAAGAPAGDAPRGGGPLDQFCTDLTAQALAGKIDPILGRDAEIRQMVDILTRRRQNNPILTGEPGVGKTAVVEGLALRIAASDVPDAVKGVRLMSLDMGLLQAGAGVKGEFENRLKGVIDAVKSSPKPILLFIDEAHTLIGAGGQAGQNDAANLLKPALARGELRCIAATTWAEYKKYFEKDAALTRRFQVVKVEEPSEPLAAAMLRGLVATLEKHHNVRILDEAVAEAVKLSARFIPSRQLPDKGVSLLDTACARVSMSQASIPAPVEDRTRRIALIETEIGSHRSRDRDGRGPRCPQARAAGRQGKGAVRARRAERALGWRKGSRRPHQGPAQPGGVHIDRAAVRGGCRQCQERAGGSSEGAANPAGRGAARAPRGGWSGGGGSRGHLDRNSGRPNGL